MYDIEARKINSEKISRILKYICFHLSCFPYGHHCFVSTSIFSDYYQNDTINIFFMLQVRGMILTTYRKYVLLYRIKFVSYSIIVC